MPAIIPTDPIAPTRQPHFRGWPSLVRALLAAVVAIAAMPSTVLIAQTSAGVGDDAIPVPRGGTRIHIGGLWTDLNSRFAPTADGGSQRGSLLGGLASNAVGVKAIPALAPNEQAIRALSGISAFTLSLGALEAKGDVRSNTVPFMLEIGVMRRLSVAILVPYTETRSNAVLWLNRNGTGANVGENPARTSSSGALAANGALLAQIDAARAALAAEITRCAVTGQTGGSCDAIRANPSGAEQLVNRAATTRAGIANLYGDGTKAGAPFVPITQSTTQLAILANLTQLQTTFTQFGVTNMDGTAAPMAATTVWGSNGLQRLTHDTLYHLPYDTLSGAHRSGMGDIDLTATLLLFDSFHTDQGKRLSPSGIGVRSAITGGWRFGTATADRAANRFDAPTGDGAPALLLRSTTDVTIGKRFWVSGTVRVVRPTLDHIATPVPAVSDSSLFAPFTIANAARTLGQRVDLELAPRLSIGRFLGVSAAWIYHRRDGDVLSFNGNDASNVEQRTPATQAHQFVVGLSYSTLATYMQRQTRLPIEVLMSHAVTFLGSGGVVPAPSFDRLELRIYTGFPRR